MILTVLHVNEVEISQVSILYADIIITETIFTLIWCPQRKTVAVNRKQISTDILGSCTNIKAYYPAVYRRLLRFL